MRRKVVEGDSRLPKYSIPEKSQHPRSDGPCPATVAPRVGGGFVLVRDTATGKERARLKHAKGVFCATFSLDGKFLATGSECPAIRLWDAATGKELRRFGGDARQDGWLALTFV